MVLRIRHSSSFCEVVSAKRTSTHWYCSKTAFSCSPVSYKASKDGPSSSINKSAATWSFKSNTTPSFFITHSTPLRSINSTADGVMPALKIAETASQACSFEVKEANNNTFWAGFGINFTTISVTMPKVPSEPINN